jgi:flagellar hook-associated protein 2
MLSYYKNNLNAIGAYVSDNGTINVDQDAVKQAAQETQTDNRFQIVRSFANQLVHKTSQISLDPMQYITKKIVAYKNPGHNYSAPYVSSSYSGMLFNYYC